MTPLQDIRAAELGYNQYGDDGTSRLIDWDGERIPGLVSDVDAVPGDAEAGIERKMISVRKADINVKPVPGDEILLNLDFGTVDDGDYWAVAKVRDMALEYDIYFTRYVS